MIEDWLNTPPSLAEGAIFFGALSLPLVAGGLWRLRAWLRERSDVRKAISQGQAELRAAEAAQASLSLARRWSGEWAPGLCAGWARRRLISREVWELTRHAGADG